MSGLRLSLHPLPAGTEPGPDDVVFEPGTGTARIGGGSATGDALRWRLGPDGGDVEGALLSAPVALGGDDWLVRCDTVWFPPGSVAHRHVHPGPGIRYLLQGTLTVETAGHTTPHGPAGAWFESGPEPVLATASATEETEFVRVLLLPPEWAGQRTIRYLDPTDAERPKLQRATVLLEQPLGALPR